MTGGVQRTSRQRESSRVSARRMNPMHRAGTRPALECLESRQLLSLYTGFSHVRNVPTPYGVYSLQVQGPGILKTSPAGGGAFDVKVLGTTEASTLTISQVRPRFHVPNGPMTIRNLTIGSGQIGSILAGSVELAGAMTPLSGSVGSLELGALGPAAQIDVHGSVSTFDVGSVNLGPGGHVLIAGDVNSAFQSLGQSAAATALTISSMNLNGGQFIIGRDSLEPISIAGDFTLSHNGLFAVGRDQTGTVTVGGSVVIDSGGQISVGRNLAALSVGGNIQVDPGASGIVVGGDLSALSVGGFLRGQGSASATDLGVGLNLNSLTVLGGGASQGGIQSANINVAKNLSNVNVAHGIFGSWITAGVGINNVNVGADGTTAIYNSEIDAGTSISNVTLGGDLTSGFPTGDTTGYPTRIIAGKVRSAVIGSPPDQGLYLPNGTISNFAIGGSLINAVLAASVAPYGGDGSLPPPVPYGGTPRTSGPPPTGFSNYNAPGGLTQLSTGQSIKNYSIRSFVNGQPLPVAVYDTATDPNVHVNVLDGGTITATVSGSVISTPHDDSFDFTGIFAVNTAGVNGGLAP